MDLREDDLVDPDRHWYYQAKARAIDAELRRHAAEPGALLDLGAGSGFFARYLLDAGVVASAVCVDPGYSEEDLARSEERLRFVRSLPVDAFVVTVPAFMSLRSSHDEYLLHFRRYRRAGLRKAIAHAEVRVHSLRYLFGALFLIAFVLRRLRRRPSEAGSDLNEVPRWLNASLLGWFTFEHRFLPQRLFGLSVLAVGTKQG